MGETHPADTVCSTYDELDKLIGAFASLDRTKCLEGIRKADVHVHVALSVAHHLSINYMYGFKGHLRVALENRLPLIEFCGVGM